ncbi:LysR family transcriptional regulator [Paraburkholderia haematera]|uniref:Octopine catabolism/uptake operon regulatory protein OccR n=1 Tax=Paraburkholderia haematera TaxID=2793077 RepID=A0ABN7LWG7_9BURK|nr:LysR family transcriptional regulator [Paraburkholderia haematera]CAE6765539.1 Octopine catabolism/uptake operon regulatory protein OccR [Paraburkholderia haematera]
MKINLRQIEVFRAIMLSGSISGASRVLFVSQPAVSRLISYTEQRLGFLLFKRIKGRLVPTPEAQRLFEEIGGLYEYVQRVNEIADNLAENRVGQLRLACSPNIGQSVMPRAIAIFCERYPDVRIALHTLIPGALVHSLQTQQVELGIAYMPVAPPTLDSRPLYANRLVAALPAGHPLTARDVIRAAELVNEPLIGYSNDIPFGQLTQQVFGGAESQPSSRVEVKQAHVACAMVQAGIGIALVDEITMQGPIWSNIVTRPIAPEINAPIEIFSVQFQPLSRLAEEFIAILESLRI